MHDKKTEDAGFELIHITRSLIQIYPKTYTLIFFLLLLLATGLLIRGLFMPILTFKEVLWVEVS